MAANPNPGGNVYNRNAPEDTHEAWNAVIRKVNEERANPPEDTNCDELDPIDEVEVDHIWTKKDIEDLRDAIDEMCEFAWVEDLEFWHDDILTEIDDALDRGYGGWGDEGECCHEECIPDCDNAQGTVETYIGSFIASACHNNPTEEYCTHAQRQAAIGAGFRAAFAVNDWVDFWREYCVLVKEVEDLERELEILEEQLAALEEARDIECAKPEPNRCEQRQQAVDEKQQEVDDKQDELTAKEVERDAKKAEADAVEAVAETEAASSMALIDMAAPANCQFYYSSIVGNAPWTNMVCDELGPECFGKHPDRCSVYWRVESFMHLYWCFAGTWSHDKWRSAMRGGYTMNGSPYVYSINNCAGVPFYACVCTGANCCLPGFGGCGTGCYIIHEYEVRLLQFYPSTHPGGEVCCD